MEKDSQRVRLVRYSRYNAGLKEPHPGTHLAQRAVGVVLGCWAKEG